MDRKYFITITGLGHYYDNKPLEIGRIVRITKEPYNIHDNEAIRVELPFIGTIGYVANSVATVLKGTVSAGRLYDNIGEYAYARIMFITDSGVIGLVLSPEEVEECDDDEQDEKSQDEDNDFINRILGFNER